MDAINLRRFSNMEILRILKESDLRSLLLPYASYFETCLVKLESPIDLGQLVAVLFDPDERTPEPLLNALYLIHEFSSPAGSEALVEVVRGDPALRDAVDLKADLTPLDLAVRVYLKAPDVLEREHVERFVETRKAFEYYRPERTSSTVFKALTPETTSLLETQLSQWFGSKLKGEHVRVFCYPRDCEITFLVRHGDAFRREPEWRDGKSAAVFYRPERNDVLFFQPSTGELRVSTLTKGERELYRRAFGLHLFGSEDHFRGDSPKFTLKPLLEPDGRALVCGDVNGIDWVHLVDLSYVRPPEDPATNPIVDVRGVERRTGSVDAPLPDNAEIVSARFRMKFSDSRRPRHVTLRLPNVAMFTRDDDEYLVNEWLTKRGFVVGA